MGANIVFQHHFTSWELNDRIRTEQVFTNCSRVPPLEKVWMQYHVARIHFQHLHKAWQRITHAVIVSEDLFAVPSPHVFPDILRVYTHTVDEPL